MSVLEPHCQFTDRVFNCAHFNLRTDFEAAFCNGKLEKATNIILVVILLLSHSPCFFSSGGTAGKS